MPSVIAHYQEIALKGKNRPWFLRRLVRHLRELLGDLSVREIRKPMGRLEIVFDDEADWPEIRERLSRGVGLANFALTWRAPLDPDAIVSGVLEHLPAEDAASFRVSVRRADKRFAMASPDLERLVGQHVQRLRGWPVNLSAPALRVWIEIVPGGAFYYYGKLPGPGGLPVGASGRVAVLLSGGIDSPVAAWRMIRRGCHALFIHFHSYPFLSRTSQDKARDLVRLLTKYQLHSRLYLVPFGELQRQITMSVPGPLRVVIYRRMMLRIAEQLARRLRVQALVTGEVVGQVASQTLDNLTVIGSASGLPVLRPLIGMDKEQIVGEAERLGSYPISVIPDEDCCTLFTPRNPVTRARPAMVHAVEQAMPLAEMVDQAVAAAIFERFTFPRVTRSPAEAAQTVGEERW